MNSNNVQTHSTVNASHKIRSKESLTNEKIIESGDIEIILKILDFHNIPTDSQENILNVTFMNTKLEGEGVIKFIECPCNPVDTASSIWRLKLDDVNESTLIDISSSPIILSISKEDTLSKSSITLNETEELASVHFNALAICCIDMGDLISDQIQTIRSKVQLHPSQSKNSPYVHTHPYHMMHPDVPQISYILTTSKPIPTYEHISRVTIKTEFIMNLSSKICKSENKFRVSIDFPLADDTKKTSFSFNQGYSCTFKEFPTLLTRYGLSNLPGDAKFSNVPTRRDTNFSDLQPEFLDGNLNIDSKSKVISLNEICSFQLYTQTVKRIVENATLPVEITCKNPSKIYKLHGNIDLTLLNYVDRKTIRQAVPLVLVSSTSTTKIKSKPKLTGTKKKSKTSLKSLSRSESEADVNTTSTAEATAQTYLIVEITLDQPLIPRKIEVMKLNEIRTSDDKVFSESGVPSLELPDLLSIFRAEIRNFAEKYSKTKGNEPNSFNEVLEMAEDNLLASTAMLIEKKFHFEEAIDEDILQELLRKSYVFLINEVRDVLSSTTDFCTDYTLEKLINFRLQCGEECRELGYLCAKDFYIMNIKDTASSSRSFLDYAVFNFRIGDEKKALACVQHAQEKDPNLIDCYILEAYFYYKKNNEKCESILQKLTKKCPGFLEAWILLDLFHIDDFDYPEQQQIKEGMRKAKTSPYSGQLHQIHCAFWEPGKSMKNIFAIAISNFIRWGCIGFAELILANSIRELKCFSNEYDLLKAVVCYARDRYEIALEILSEIKRTCTCRHFTEEVNRLNILCYLKLQSPDVLSNVYILNINRDPDTYTPQCNLLNVMIGKFLAESGSRVPGLLYLKKAYKDNGTYASIMEIGKLSVKYSARDDALACFRMANKINPYDWYPLVEMALMYYRSGMIEQYRICAKNARENKITDEIISQELDKIDQIIINE